MNNSNSNSSDSSNFTNKRKNVNKKISDCLQKCELFQNKNSRISSSSHSAYETEANYQKSFTEIEKFSKKITEKKRKLIDCCIYNQNNVTDYLVRGYFINIWFTLGTPRTKLLLFP